MIRAGATHDTAVVFDLGNVIVGFDHRIAARRIAAAAGTDEDTVLGELVAGNAGAAFETGELSTEAFAAHCAARFGAPIGADELRDAWNDIFTEHEAVSDIVRALAGRVRLVLLSNTNAWHYAYLAARTPVLALFDERVLSFERGVRKPDPRIFEHARGATRGARRIVYVDDIAEYVRAGERHGFTGIVFEGADALSARLGALGLL